MMMIDAAAFDDDDDNDDNSWFWGDCRNPHCGILVEISTLHSGSVLTIS